MALGPVMLDIEGTALTRADRELLAEPAVGGLILFSRNYASPEQVTELVREVRAIRKPPLLVAVDYEGGRVQRFGDGFTPLPAMRRIGRLYDGDPEAALGLARTAGWLIGAELRACDIDLSFSPCVDLDWGVNAAIGDRAFHKNPLAVSDLARQFSLGLRNAGMASVAKHFPGHGAVAADSHERLPVDHREIGDILDDMRPYESLRSHGLLPAVMMSHVVYDELDRLPASLSRFWMSGQLRGQLRFDGAIFTDDMSMKATAAFGSMPVRARMALEAGADMVLVCNDRRAAAATVAALDDYLNPPSLVRLARLHGEVSPDRQTLMAMDEWQQAVATLERFGKPPTLELDA